MYCSENEPSFIKLGQKTLSTLLLLFLKYFWLLFNFIYKLPKFFNVKKTPNFNIPLCGKNDQNDENCEPEFLLNRNLISIETKDLVEYVKPKHQNWQCLRNNYVENNELYINLFKTKNISFQNHFRGLSLVKVFSNARRNYNVRVIVTYTCKNKVKSIMLNKDTVTPFFPNMIKSKIDLCDSVKVTLIEDNVCQFVVNKMQKGESSTGPQHQLTVPVYTAATTVLNPFALESKISSIVEENKKRHKSEEYSASKGSDYYYKNAYKRYVSGGNETLRRVNEEMSKTLKDGVGTLNYVNFRLREYFQEMESSEKLLASNCNINNSNVLNTSFSDLQKFEDSQKTENKTEDLCESKVENKEPITLEQPVEKAFTNNENLPAVENEKNLEENLCTLSENEKERKEDKVVKEKQDKQDETHEEKTTIELESLQNVLSNVDEISNYESFSILEEKQVNEDDKVRIQITEKSKTENENELKVEMVETEEKKPLRNFEIKTVEYDASVESQKDIKKGELPTEKKKRKIKIITKKSLLSNTTIIEVQSPKTSNKTREEKLQELIKALSKKSGDERIKQIMEFLQEQAISSKALGAEVVEDIPRIKAFTNIHRRLKQEELARDSLFEFQRKMSQVKQSKVGSKSSTNSKQIASVKSVQDNNIKKKMIRLRAQELFMPERHINRLKVSTAVFKEKDDSMSSLSSSSPRNKSRTAKYLDKRRSRFIQHALDINCSHDGGKISTITMPKDANTIKKTLEGKSISMYNSDPLKTDINMKNESNKAKEVVVHAAKPKKVQEISINVENGNNIGLENTSPRKNSQKFYDLKENTDYSKNPVEDYAKDKHKWLRYKTDPAIKSKNNLYCFDILDEIMPNDVLPLKSEYPRRDNIIPANIPHPCESFLGKLTNRGNRNMLETLLTLETPKIVCSSPHCITCKTNSKNFRLYRKKSILSHHSHSSGDESSLKNRKKSSVPSPKQLDRKDTSLKPKTVPFDRNPDFKLKSFLKGKELPNYEDQMITKTKSAGFEGTRRSSKSGRNIFRKIQSDRSRPTSQRNKKKVKSVKFNPSKKKENELTKKEDNNSKKKFDHFTKQEIEEKLKKYMIDPSIRFPTTMTVMPVSVVYQALETSNGNARMVTQRATIEPFVVHAQNHRRASPEKISMATNTSNTKQNNATGFPLERNPSYIFTSSTNETQAILCKSPPVINNNKEMVEKKKKEKKQKNVRDLVEEPKKKSKNKGVRIVSEEYDDVDEDAKLQKSNSRMSVEVQGRENSQINASMVGKKSTKRGGVKAPSSTKYKVLKSVGSSKPSNEITPKVEIQRQKSPLKKLRDKNRTSFFKEDIQKVIQSVELKMVDILSDPGKQNMKAFIDVENEITSVLEKFQKQDSITEEGINAIGQSDTSATSKESAPSHDKEKNLSERIAAKNSPRRKISCCIKDKNQDPTYTRPQSPMSYIEVVEKKEKGKIFEVPEKFKSNPVDKKSQKCITIPPLHLSTNQMVKNNRHNNKTVAEVNRTPSKNLPQNSCRLKQTPSTQVKPHRHNVFTASRTTLLTSRSFTPSLPSPSSPINRFPKSRTMTSFDNSFPTLRVSTSSSAASRPFMTPNKVEIPTKLSSSKVDTPTTDIPNNSEQKSVKIKTPLSEINPIEIPETDKVIKAEVKYIVEVLCDKKGPNRSDGSGDEKIDTKELDEVNTDNKEITNDKIEMNEETHGKVEEILDITETKPNKEINEDPIEIQTDSFEDKIKTQLTENEFNQEEEEKCFITAAYEPKPFLSRKIDLTLAKIEQTTKTIEKALKSKVNIPEQRKTESDSVSVIESDKISTEEKLNVSTVDSGGYGEGPAVELKEKKEETETEKSTDSATGQGETFQDNVVCFLEKLSTLSPDKEELKIKTYLTKIVSKRCDCRICIFYYEPTIFCCINNYHRACCTSGVTIPFYRPLKDDFIYDKREIKKLLKRSKKITSQNFNDNISIPEENREKFYAVLLNTFYGLIFALSYFGLTFNYTCLFVD